MARALTAEAKAKIIELWRAGEKGEYIAALIGCSYTAVCRLAQTAGLARGKGRRRKAA